MNIFISNSSTPATNRGLCWFRRDLRIDDHAALHHALIHHPAVHGVFVFDTEILDALPSRKDLRVEFIWYAIQELADEWRRHGAHFTVLHGRARDEIPRFAQHIGAHAVYCNRDDEPAAQHRDHAVALALQAMGIDFRQYKDQVIFEREEVLSAKNRPYGVFTPYRHAWLKKFTPADLQPHDTKPYLNRLAPGETRPLPPLSALGFDTTVLTELPIPLGSSGAARLLADFSQRLPAYDHARNYPAVKGVSYLSAHLRFGTLSIRQVAALAHSMTGAGPETFLSELIWRDFYQMILYHRPDLAQGHAYQPRFDTLPYPGSTAEYEGWCQAHTGYPLIDAAMRQLQQTGYMHNRLRMIAASFLVKDLQVDWRWGERYFADHLLDYDLAANNGGWQWCASTGCDAQPWFRLFNPVTQSERFDPEGKFIRRYVPELAHCPLRWIHAPWRMAEQEWLKYAGAYWPPMVDHGSARIKTLALYGSTSPSDN
ncbi:MAG: deoxyribodipyrimidine photo-lyase [Ferrovum sp.]|nr:deoxyribodipyrimidine photo-lyase [Ferrovum sp.]NDU87130.1 deoxyribodipyrimidine photo-lyase [Ferrovum sp.]